MTETLTASRALRGKICPPHPANYPGFPDAARSETGYCVCEIVDGSQVERIDAASVDILEIVEILFRDPIALQGWKSNGAKVLGELVFLDRGWCGT